jgi:predicted enzyme related to lactoylglutathione lyase
MATLEKPAQAFTNIAFVVIPVKEVRRAREFFEGSLGLKVTSNWQDEWIEYDIGAGTIAVTAGYPGREAGVRGALVAIEVARFDELLANLRAGGLPIVGEPFDTPVCRGVTIRDPDGNEFLLHAKK